MKHTTNRIIAALLALALLFSTTALAANRSDLDVVYSDYMVVANTDGIADDERIAAAETATVDMLKLVAELTGADAEAIEAVTTADEAALLIAKTLDKNTVATDATAAWTAIVNYYDEIVLAKGDKGDSVKAMQNGLLALDPNALPKFGADGSLGDESTAAIAAYQTANGLEATGTCDAATLALLTAEGTDPVYALMAATAKALDDGREATAGYTTTEYIAMTDESAKANTGDAIAAAEAKLDMSYVIAILLLGGNRVADKLAPNSLRVSVAVVNEYGNAISEAKSFEYTVALTTTTAWTEPEYTFGNTVFAPAETDDETAPVTTVTTTVAVTNGSYVTFTDLPAGATYTVTQAPAEGYTPAVNGATTDTATGTIAADGGETVAFVNTREAGVHEHVWVDVTETVTVPEEGHYETVHYPAGSHEETVYHPEEGHYETINHPAVTHTEKVNHPAVTHTETINHPEVGHYETKTVVDKEAYDEQVWHETKAAWDETVKKVACKCGAKFDNYDAWCSHSDSKLVSGEGGHTGYSQITETKHHDAEGYYETKHHDAVTHTEQVWVVDKKAWTETKTVVDKEAWTETVTVADKAAWTEKVWVVDKKAWTETVTVVDKTAHDERVWVVDKAATTTQKVVGQRCEICNETK